MEHIEDDRFAHVSTDPRFRCTPKSIRKVKIDKRFQSLFTDKRFQVKYSTDKRGRPVNQSSHENFRKYYDLSSEDDSSEEEDDLDERKEDKLKDGMSVQIKSNKTDKLISNDVAHPIKTKKANQWLVTPLSEEAHAIDNSHDISENNTNKKDVNIHKQSEQSSHINADLDTDKIEKARMTDEIKMKLRDPNIDYSRGVGALMSDSSSEEESSEDSESESELDHGWGELDADADTTEEATDRLAVLHMDWDRIRAVDLMVLFNSFLPVEGVIESITIYPSQFGLERMKEEEEKGPKELVNEKVEDEAGIDEESKDGRKYHMERLRQYQLNRLKYYYAVIKFDSVETASKVYTECDGLEYESSATKLDLRFVPEGETFDQEPREVCTGMPDPAKYEPRLFTNTALQQGKVELTWDETDPGRQEFTKKIQKNADKFDNADLQAYLACSSDEGDEDEPQDQENAETDERSDEDVKEEHKIARYKSLLASLEEEEDKKKSRDVDLEITWGVGLKEKAEKLIKEKQNAPQTPFEEMLVKRRQKKKAKREEKTKQKGKEQESDSGDNLYSDDDLPSDVDMSDPYFKEELQASKSKKKKKIVSEEESEEAKQKKAELELLLLEENDLEKEKNHFNIKAIQDRELDGKKKKRRKQLKKRPQISVKEDKDNFEVDVADQRFSALYNSHHFNIDPSDPHFHKTKAMDAFITEKLKRRKEREHEPPPPKARKTDPELSLLVKSIKKKTKHKYSN